MSAMWTTCFVWTTRPKGVAGLGRKRLRSTQRRHSAGGALCECSRGETRPRRADSMLPNLASQMRVAFSSIAWNTGSSSPGELEMTLQHLRGRGLLLQRLG